MANGGKSTFILALQGQITTAQFPEHDSIWIRYNFVAGPDWTFLSGDTEGISASCFRNSNQRFVFNLPFAATFRTTNAFRWPQLVITCFGRDFWGNEVVKGYGAVPMPTVLGRHRLEAACSAPEPSSAFQGFIGMVTGKTPELIDPNLLAGPDTREVLRMATEGLVSVEVDVMHKDMKRNGFDWDIGTLRTPSTAPLPVLETIMPENPAEDVAKRRPPPLASLAIPSSQLLHSSSDLLSPTMDIDREESGASLEEDWRPPAELASRPLPEPFPDPLP